jgi:hypothetical protein
MFGLFSKNKPPECPIDLEMRLWMEHSFLWVATQFGHDYIRKKRMLLPVPDHFPVRYDGSLTSLIKTAEIVAVQMEVDLGQINLQTYKQSIQEFGGDLGYRIFTEVDKSSEEKLSAGLYFDKNENGKYDIFIEERGLMDPEVLAATLSHEFSHIKLLGEQRIAENDELLTDLFTVVFGFGIFNANASFKELKSFDTRGHYSIGYLKQQEWGYALALYAHFREEENPGWVKYLSPNIRSDFKKSQSYIFANMDKVFWEDYQGPGNGN